MRSVRNEPAKRIRSMSERRRKVEEFEEEEQEEEE